MSDRSNKPSFAVSRNLKQAKYNFIEAIADKLTESSNTTPNSVSTSTWLCVTSNMISTSHKTWQTSLLFLKLLQIQNLKRKSGGTSHIMSPPPEKVGGHVPRVPHQIAPCLQHCWGQITGTPPVIRRPGDLPPLLPPLNQLSLSIVDC